jgi:glycosyltransferase involved in cell wall biosynthesis
VSRVFINGLHAKAGGGKSILSNYLSLLKHGHFGNTYIVLTPDKRQYVQYSGGHVQMIEIADRYNKQPLFPLLYEFVLPNILRNHRIDAILNFGDLVIPSRLPQIYCFDWPYAVYPQSIAWQRLDLAGYISRKVKLFVFKRYLPHATKVVAQSPTMDQKLRSIYGLDNTVVIPNAVSLENLSGGDRIDFGLPTDKKKLLCLTHYYPHKNIEVLIPLAQRIRDRGLPICVITTIAATQHNYARRFLRNIKRRGLQDVLINLGPITMANVPSLYEQSDALFMPTLLESFSGTYVEAMFHRKSIFTSRLDFAEDVCGDAAFYFDPTDEDSILEAILRAFQNEDLRREKIDLGSDRLKRMLSWNEVFYRLQELVELELRMQATSTKH